MRNARCQIVVMSFIQDVTKRGALRKALKLITTLDLSDIVWCHLFFEFGWVPIS